MQKMRSKLIRRIQKALQVWLSFLVEKAIYPNESPSASRGLVLRISGNAKSPRLESLFSIHGSDKGWDGTSHTPFAWAPHNYADFYEFLFMARRNSVRTVVECGIGTNNTDVASNMTSTGKPGASLRAWRDYFPHANIIGLDIDSRILFSEDRIQTFQVDQTDSEGVRRFWESSGISDVDIIIDDGLHTFEAGVSFFESSIERLHRAGIFIIEDVVPDALELFTAYFHRRPETVHYLQLFRKGAPIGDNTLIVIQPA